MGYRITRAYESQVRSPLPGSSEADDRPPVMIQQSKKQVEEIRARRQDISDQACREFSIERAAKAFLDAIKSVREELA